MQGKQWDGKLSMIKKKSKQKGEAMSMITKTTIQKIKIINQLNELDPELFAKLRRRTEEALRKMPAIAKRTIADMIVRGEIKFDDILQ